MTGQRGGAFGVVVAAHLLVLAVALQVRTTAEPAKVGAITAIAVADAPAVIRVVVPPMTEIGFDTAMPEPQFAIAGDGTGECALDARIGEALGNDTRARAALATLPRNVRSVANTAMLWDGRWSAPESAPEAVRTVIVETVRDATPQCREAPLIGPRLVIVATVDGLALAFGSGRWSWSDLLL